MEQQGKINFTGLIKLLIIIYSGYAAVKLINTSTTNTRIRKVWVKLDEKNSRKGGTEL